MGVDVFFVISGYLICGGILRDLELERFSLTSFYHRRIRRIFPAYFVLVFSVLLVGITIYHWARLIPLAQTALFSTAFSTNLYFWLSMGYFQPSAHANPLLHLWSLGVEEHFYLIIPIAFPLILKFRKKMIMPSIALAGVVSFLCCLYFGQRGDSTTAFYILPTRAWEMLAGAMICRVATPVNSKLSGWIGMISAFTVVAAYWCVSTAATATNAGTNVEILLFGVKSLGFTPFPGWVLIPVVVGSVLLIRYGSIGIVGRLLSSKPFVGIGKISYSLYLWHWPILVFARYINYEKQNLQVSLIVLALSFLFGYLSWRWVETPVRVGSSFTVKRAFVILTMGSGILASVSITMITTLGFKNHIHQDANKFVSSPIEFKTGFEKFKPSKPPFKQLAFPDFDDKYIRLLGDPKTVPSFCLLGDSHSGAIAPGLDAAARLRGVSGYYFEHRMHPFVTFGQIPPRILDWIAGRKEIVDVYLAGRWLMEYKIMDGIPELGDKGKIDRVVLNAEQAMRMESDFRVTAEWFSKHEKNIYVFSCVPEYYYNPCDIMARSRLMPLKYSIEITERDYKNRQSPVTELLKTMAHEGIISYVPLGEIFIENGESVFMAKDGTPFYRDGDHLTLDGAKHAAKILAPTLWPSTTRTKPTPESIENN